MPRKVAIISFVCFSALTFARSGFSVPALTTIHQIDQPDGNTFAARLWGDEKAHGWETAEGYTIVKDPVTKYWHYAQKQSGTGQMIPAGIVGAESVTTGTRRHLRPEKAAGQRIYGLSAEAMQAGRMGRSPVTGSRPIPVMMVNFSFSEYDTGGDCYVDAVVIIHQGSGEEAGGPDGDIWSHRWDLNSAAYYGDGSSVYTTNDVAACGSIKIKDYVIQPETLWGGIQTVGVFAHEYGHVLGLPDLYDIDYSSNGILNAATTGEMPVIYIPVHPETAPSPVPPTPPTCSMTARRAMWPLPTSPNWEPPSGPPCRWLTP